MVLNDSGVPSLAVSDHLRLGDAESTDDDLPPGVYRVVGTPADGATLLRVADSDGRRRHTGEVYSVPESALEPFEAAENPDENRPLTGTLASQLDGVVWQFRTLGRTVRERPIPGSAALALVVVGLFGDSFLSMPDHVDTMLFLAGVLWLFYLPNRTGSR